MDGRHIKVLGKGDPRLLGDATLIEDLLRDMVDYLGMRAIAGPVICNVELDIRKLGEEPFEDEGGVTGVVVLSTSHIAIHTWPLRDSGPREMFVLDVFSCRSFDDMVVMRLLERVIARDVQVWCLSDMISDATPSVWYSSALS